MIEIDNILDVEKQLDGIDVAIFDLDDTLYSEKEYVRSGFDALGRTYPNVVDFSKRLWNAFVQKKQAIDFVLGQEGLTKEKENCLTVYRQHAPSISLYSGVYEMLERIGEKRSLGIITDGRVEGQKAKISALGIANLFEKIIITDELGGAGYRKPDKTSFVLMREFFKTEYSKMCYVGDNLSKDGLAPEELGMLFIHFKNSDGLYR